MNVLKKMQAKLKSIFIIVPVHNRMSLTRECLLSLRGQTFKNYKVIVVDDGSTDRTSDMIKKEFSEVILLKGDGNLWWTGATNLGVEFALEHAEQSGYILTLNNDVTVRMDYLQCLFDSASNHPNSLIGSIFINNLEETTVVDAGIYINWLTAKYTILGKGRGYNEILKAGSLMKEVDVLSGRGTLIPIEVFKKVGLYNFKCLPQYGADYELSRRAVIKGYKLLINYEAVVIGDLKFTGINKKIQNSNWPEFAKIFFSIRSPCNIHCRWNFARLACPKFLLFTFFILDMGRVFCRCLSNKLQANSKFF
jgi:GT2 family glycosyltransferase